MRRTKLPDDAPPLAETSSGILGDPNPGGGPAVAAKVGLCLGLFAFLLNYGAATSRVQLSAAARLWVVGIVSAMIVAGMVLAVGALVANRRKRRPGLIGFAAAAVAINGFLIAVLAYALVRH